MVLLYPAYTLPIAILTSAAAAAWRALAQPGDEEEGEQDGGDAYVDWPWDTGEVQYGAC
jgi:hypothetical protein